MFLMVLEIFAHADDFTDHKSGVLSSRAQLCALSWTVLTQTVSQLPRSSLQPNTQRHHIIIRPHLLGFMH